MSGTTKYPAAQALALAEQITGDLSDLCAFVEIAGSLRREKPMVGDVEIVALPTHAPTLLARLDSWVATGRVVKAVYANGTSRWGDKYRGLAFAGFPMKIEIFLADADNWGYILWLRTGPGDANAYVMQQCIARKAPYRAVDGYWTAVAGGRRLRVPNEAEMFRLLGIPHLPPAARTLERYQQLMRGHWAKTWAYADVEDAAPTQQEMF